MTIVVIGSLRVNILGKHTLGYLLEVPGEYPQCKFSWRNKKNIFWRSLLIWSYENTAGWVDNSENHDQMQPSAMFDLGLHCLLRHICPSAWDKYGIKCDFSSKELQKKKKKKNLWKIALICDLKNSLPVCLQRVNKNSVINIHAYSMVHSVLSSFRVSVSHCLTCYIQVLRYETYCFCLSLFLTSSIFLCACILDSGVNADFSSQNLKIYIVC